MYSGWLWLIFTIGVVVAVCLSLEEPPDGDGSVQPGLVPAGVRDSRCGVVDVEPAGHGGHPPSWLETLMGWVNQPSGVVALGIIAVGVVLIVLLRPRVPRE
jgi:hypothetical protein